MNSSQNVYPVTVTVLMCAYNVIDYIGSSVQCILDQTFDDWELVISDDGSTDGTREWLQENLGNNPKVRLYFQERNLGYVLNKNFVHKQARGQYITQMDADDLCEKDKIKLQLKLIEQKPDIKVVATGYNRVDMFGNIIGNNSLPMDLLIPSKSRGPYPFWFPSMLIHHQIFKEFGYFYEYFNGIYGDDFYWTLLVNQKYPIYCINTHLYSYRNNPNSLTNVYSNNRKLIVPEILHFLENEVMSSNGVDILAVNPKKVIAFEEKLLSDKTVMSFKFCTWAAMSIDKNDYITARTLLKKAFFLAPFSIQNLKTALYYFRKNLFK